MSNQPNFSQLCGGNFCEQQLVLLNTVKWSTFCVNFIRVLTILVWLQCFKIDYLVTSNVRFEMVSINPVTFYVLLHAYLSNFPFNCCRIYAAIYECIIIVVYVDIWKFSMKKLHNHFSVIVCSAYFIIIFQANQLKSMGYDVFILGHRRNIVHPSHIIYSTPGIATQFKEGHPKLLEGWKAYCALHSRGMSSCHVYVHIMLHLCTYMFVVSSSCKILL